MKYKSKMTVCNPEKEDFIEWLDWGPSKRPALVNFSCFRELDFNSINMSCVSFNSCRFVGVSFSNCSMLSAQFNNCVFENCKFNNVDGPMLSIEKSAFFDVEFDKCDIGMSVIQDSYIEDCSFTGCDLTSTSLDIRTTNTTIRNSKMTNCVIDDERGNYITVTKDL